MCAVTGPSGEATHLQTDFSHDRSCGMGLCCVLVQAVQRSGLSHQQDFGYDWHNVQTFPFCSSCADVCFLPLLLHTIVLPTRFFGMVG